MVRDSFTFDLEHPVMAHGESISSLTIRPPTGNDIAQCGFPFAQERNPRSGRLVDTIEMDSMRALLSRCGNVPLSTIDALAAVDIYAGVDAVKSFFHFRIRAPSSGSTSPSENGAATKDSSSV